MHLEDAIRAILFLIHHPEITGPVNICAPECVPQKEFAKTLAKSMNRPAWMITPAFLLRLVFGEMADELLLAGQNAYPMRLTQEKFEFLYPTLAKALDTQ